MMYLEIYRRINKLRTIRRIRNLQNNWGKVWVKNMGLLEKADKIKTEDKEELIEEPER